MTCLGTGHLWHVAYTAFTDCSVPCLQAKGLQDQHELMNVCTAQLGKIGRLRRNAACLLAVVLHSADGAESDEAVALTKLLEHYPQAPKPLPKPVITQRVSSAGRPHELLRHA